ncbi:MAG: VCBS repeat-containing protein [Planctomycetota bacterium]
MTLRKTLPLAAALTAAPIGAQQFTYDATALPPGAIWTDGVELVDIDADGDIDILFANGSSYGAGGFQPQQLFLNDGAGNFSAASGQLNVANFNAKMVIAEDFDGDGDLDLMYAPEGPFPAVTQLPRMLINDGSGNFVDESATRLPALPMASFCVCAGDVDDDGDLDVVYTDGATFGGVATQARLYLNNGTGFFSDATATNMPVDTYNAQDVTLIDYDGDFDLDIALSGKGQTGKRSRLYLNNGLGSFSIVNALNNVGTGSTYEIDYGDLDGDGDLDGMVQSISVSGFSAQEGWFENNGPSITTGTFPAPNGSDDNEMAGVDYDNDGDLDVFIGSLGGTERIYRNDGSFAFVNQDGQIQSQNDSTLDFGFADLDNDGAVDMVTGQGESGNFTNKVYFNNGPADTVAPTILGTETPTYGGSSTVFHATTQDVIQDDGSDSFVTATYTAWQGSTSGVQTDSGTAMHQGGGTWRAEVSSLAGATGAQMCWTFTDREGNTSTSSATAGTVADWTDLGQGLAGGSGIPTLTGTGTPAAGQNINLDLSGAAPNAPGGIVINANADYLPLFGGTLVPSLAGAAIILPYTTDGSGSIATISGPWPTGPSDCTVLHFQAGTLDFGAPQGFSFSNALAAIQK